MEVYVLTEDSDNLVKIYLFSTLEKAQEKMKSLYEHIINKLDKNDLKVGNLCLLDFDAYIETPDDSWDWKIRTQEVE